jgi:hypothetical protein
MTMNADLRNALIEMATEYMDYGQDNLPAALIAQASETYRQITAAYVGYEALLDDIYDAEADVEPVLGIGLIAAFGATTYGTPAEAVTYYADMARMARRHPELFAEVASLSERTDYSRTRTLAVEHQWTDITLGCLLIGPTHVYEQLSLDALLPNMDSLTTFVELAKELAPQRLERMVKVVCDGLLRHELDVADPEQVRLRMLMFDGALINYDECTRRLANIGHALHGAKSKYTSRHFRNDLEAIALCPDYLEHGFIPDLYRCIASHDDEYSLRDPCEEQFEALAQSILNENIKTLQAFMLKHGMDYRLKLAPWVMARSMGACLELKKVSPHAELWLEHAVVTTLERHMSTDSKTGYRLLSWLSALSEQDCLTICSTEKQLMLCFQATSHSGLIQKVTSDRYREEILGTDLGL